MENEQNDVELQTKRHSMAHVMAQAVLELFPQAKLAIGPAIKDGFYYDFDLPFSLKPEDLESIEKRMQLILQTGVSFHKEVISREQALELFKDEPYKLEILKDLPNNSEISTYTQGPFTDLCRGPHVENVKQLNAKAFKLMSVAGAYWRGDEKRPMLQRIYATLWNTQKELEAYLANLEEQEKRDHRKLGRKLDLFSTHEEAGPGLIYWHPKGARIRLAIEDFWREAHYANQYEMLFTPHVGKSWLWQTSGHLDYYQESMFSPIEMDKSDYYVKPMNCPFHIMIYKSKSYSYRDLPLRWAELGTVYRYEKSGVLHGTMRVRGFTQDDAHIICSEEQVEEEIEEVLRFSLSMWKAFGFSKVKAYLSTKPEKAVGKQEEWDLATSSLQRALKRQELVYSIDEGGGAFYGPKIDLKIEDSMKREWQMSTIQFDFNLPERFNMTYIDRSGHKCRPFMIHRALLGSFERFFGVLIEHFAGAFPVWLAPIQVLVVSVSEKYSAYAKQIFETLKLQGFRVELEKSDKRLGAKIREAQEEKVPYVLIVGEKELNNKSVSLRLRDGSQLNDQQLQRVIDEIKLAIEDKR